ncbi:hypothetical protein LTR60_006835, partial [Cryomyces antarcticus]
GWVGASHKNEVPPSVAGAPPCGTLGGQEDLGRVEGRGKYLPYLNDDEIDLKAREYGFTDEDEEAGQVKEARHGETEGELAVNVGGRMV